MTWKETVDGVDWHDDLSNIELWDGTEISPIVKASGFVDSWFSGEDEVPVPDLDNGLSFYSFKYWRPAMKCQVQPRLSPEGDGYICDTCENRWKAGEGPNCQIVSWKPIATHKPGHDPQKVLAWASFQVWPYCNSPEFVRPDPYWTEWKEWTVYWNGSHWKIGTEPFDCRVLKIRITHWMPRLEAPDDFDPTVYQEAYHN